MYNSNTDARQIQATSSGPVRYGRQVKRSKTLSAINTDEADPGFDAKNELHTRADTICAGANWILLSTSGQCFDVYGFHYKFKGIKYVPIARVSTGLRDEHGHMYIIIVNQALCFGAILDHSLINPNQIRNFGIPVSDTPYDSGRDFGIDHEYQCIPFKTEGSCPHMVLTDSKIQWYPHDIKMAANEPYGENAVLWIYIQCEQRGVCMYNIFSANNFVGEFTA